MKEIQSSRVFMVPDNVIDDEKNLNIIKLKHPKTNSLMACALAPDGSLYEILNVSSNFCSWVLEDSVIEDGSLYILTAFDPLYIILPYLSKIDKFCPLEDILVDETAHDTRHLFDSVTLDDLNQISESKIVSDLRVYRYDECKTLKWLQRKVSQTAAMFKEKDIDLNDGSKADILNNGSGHTEEAYTSHACKLVSEYLPTTLSQKLCEALGLAVEQELTRSTESNVESEMSQPAKKKTKKEDIKPVDDYSKYFSPELTKKSALKLSSSQKQLMKVDKTGMKSISSFFTKK